MRALSRAMGAILLTAVIALILPVSGLAKSIPEMIEVELALPEPTPTAVDSLTKLIIRANPQIRDPRRIQIGDPVRVPTARGDTTYIAEPWMLRASGAKGCFWLIAEAHLTRKVIAQAKAVPVDTTGITLANPLNTTHTSLPWALLGAAMGLILIVSLGVLALVTSFNRRRRDPYAVPPVVASGLGGSNDYVLAQIRRASETFPAYHSDPNRRISDPVRGQVISRTGEKRFIARVGQRNGTFSRRDILSGTQCVRVTVRSHDEEGREVEFFEYWLTHCGNPVAEIGRDRFEIPAGWEFVPYVVQTPPHRPTAAEPAVATPAEAKPTADTAAPATDGRPEYAVDIQIDRTDTGLSIKGASSRYISRVKVNDDGYEVEF